MWCRSLIGAPVGSLLFLSDFHSVSVFALKGQDYTPISPFPIVRNQAFLGFPNLDLVCISHWSTDAYVRLCCKKSNKKSVGKMRDVNVTMAQEF